MQCGRVVWLLVLVLAGGTARAADLSVLDAVRASDVAALSTALHQNGDPNGAAPDGTTPLHYAVHLNNLEAADLLLKAGARATTPNRYGVTPLLIAATNANAAMIEHVLTAGADPNGASPEGETPLMIAARVGVPEALAAIARPQRRRQRQGIVAGPDRADVGGGRRARAGGAAARAHRRRRHPAIEGRRSPRCCSPSARGTSTRRARCSPRTPT